jgi:hypothetical protein
MNAHLRECGANVGNCKLANSDMTQF